MLRELANRRAWKQSVMGAMNVAALVLATRMILLSSVCGAFVLALLTLRQPNPLTLIADATYAATVVLPLVWLSSRR